MKAKDYFKWLFTRWWYYVIVILFLINNLITLKVSINEISFIIGLMFGQFLIIGIIILTIRLIYLKFSKKRISS